MSVTEPTVADALTIFAADSLIEEASRIWDGAGVRLEWTSPLAPAPPARDTLRMLAVARPIMQAPANPMILGELLRPEGSRAMALVSLRDAERIAARGGGWRSRLLRERHVGIVLGRAAAHEIGHYLLNTSTHADEGLMRARFNEIEFTNPRSDAFELDEAQRAWVRQRLLAGLPLGPDAISR